MLGQNEALNTLMWLWKKSPVQPKVDEIITALGQFGFDVEDIRHRLDDPASQMTDRQWRKEVSVPLYIAFAWFTADFKPTLIPYFAAGARNIPDISVARMVRSAVFSEDINVDVGYFEQAVAHLSLDEILLHWPRGTPIEYVISFRD